MSHYDIDYSELHGAAKKAKAIKDCKDWLTTKRFNEIVSEFKQMQKPEFELFRRWISIAGIAGYPVEVLYEHIWN